MSETSKLASNLRVSRINRQWRLLQLLASHRFGLTIAELSRELKVTPKTIRRYFDVFRKVEIPIEEQTGSFGRKTWRIAEDWANPPLRLNFQEAMALFLGQRSLKLIESAPLGQAAQSAFEKLRRAFDKNTIAYLERHGGMLYQTSVGKSDYSRKGELIETLMIAIEDSVMVDITYQSQQATEPATRVVYPYGLVRHRDTMYLVAYAPDHDQYRQYKIDRISDAQSTGVPFARRDEFRLDGWLANAVGVYAGPNRPQTVRLRFSGSAARYVLEHTWHKSQQTRTNADGSVDLTLRVDITDELRHWILGFGARVLVIAPESLRRDLYEEIQQMRLHCAPANRKPGGTRMEKTR